MTRNRWFGIYSLAHILVLALLLSACVQESAPVVDEVAQVQAVPTLTPLPPPAVVEVAPTEVVIESTEVVVEETADSPSPIPPTETVLPDTPIPPTPVPTDPPPPTEEALTVVNVTTGQTDDGTFFIGDVNAPVRLVDYSDFV